MVEGPEQGPLIGRNVKRLRIERGISVRMLAHRADLSHAYISKLEAGKVPRPGFATIGAVAGVLGVPVEQLRADPLNTSANADPGAISPEIAEAGLLLHTIEQMNPDALHYLTGLIRMVKQDEERKYLEERRAKPRNPRTPKNRRPPDKEVQDIEPQG